MHTREAIQETKRAEDVSDPLGADADAAFVVRLPHSTMGTEEKRRNFAVVPAGEAPPDARGTPLCVICVDGAIMGKPMDADLAYAVCNWLNDNLASLEVMFR